MGKIVRHEMNDIGQIVGLDELLNHQIVDTFASTATSDHSWTEKIWSAMVRKDGALAIDFGLGRYHNRGILDGCCRSLCHVGRHGMTGVAEQRHIAIRPMLKGIAIDNRPFVYIRARSQYGFDLAIEARESRPQFPDVAFRRP